VSKTQLVLELRARRRLTLSTRAPTDQPSSEQQSISQPSRLKCQWFMIGLRRMQYCTSTTMQIKKEAGHEAATVRTR
jgi:hypothetical protein